MAETIRAITKRAAEQILLVSGAAALARAWHRHDVVVLAYHNIVPDDAPPCGDASLHISRSRFAEQLDLLQRTHAIVPLAEALEEPAGRRRGRPRAAITFDDAYRGAVTLGLTELARRGMSATVFVAPGLLGGEGFWWDRVAGPDGLRGPSEFRTRALEQCAGRAKAVLELASASGLRVLEVPAYARCVSEAELSAVARDGSVAVGSHSWSHPNLAALPAGELSAELVRPLAWLRERFDRVVPILAYPYGRHTASVIVAARDAGYAAALRIDGGWLRPGAFDPWRVPRVDVAAGVSVAGFAVRASGLFAA